MSAIFLKCPPEYTCLNISVYKSLKKISSCLNIHFHHWSGLNIFCFVTSGFQNILLDVDNQNICGLEADIKITDTYHIFCQPFCQMAAIKVIKMLL